MAAVGAEIDHVISSLDHVQVMLDEQHGVAGIDQPIQLGEQPLDIRQVQAGGGLIEYVDRMFGALQRAEFGGDLDPLRLTARERGRRLAER